MACNSPDPAGIDRDPLHGTGTVDEELVVDRTDHPGWAVVTVSGPLSLRTLPRISGELGKALVDRPGVVVDVSSLRVEWPPAITVFATVLRYAGGWPNARMVLFGADGDLAAALHQSQVERTVPLAPSLEKALLRLRHRPERVRRCQDFPPQALAVRAARGLARDAVTDWRLPEETAEAAALIVTELATNAVVHAGTAFRACVELTEKGFWIGVRDLRPDLPLRVLAHGRAKHSGRPSRPFGLHIVSALTRSWGVTEQTDAKIAWARLEVPDRDDTVAPKRPVDDVGGPDAGP